MRLIHRLQNVRVGQLLTTGSTSFSLQMRLLKMGERYIQGDSGNEGVGGLMCATDQAEALSNYVM